jgi:hypothetical protein
MSKLLARLGLVFMALSSFAVALASLRYYGVLLDAWPGIDAGIRGVIVQVPVQALVHMLIAPLALLTGPLQFVPALRARRKSIGSQGGSTLPAASWPVLERC